MQLPLDVLSHPNGGLPDIFVDDAGTTFNDVGEITYGRRIVQIGAKIIF